MIVDPTRAPATRRPIRLRAGPLTVHTYYRQQQFPLEVWQTTTGDVYAIVSDVKSNTSLMNAAEDIYAAILADYPAADIIECWPDGFLPDSPKGVDGAFFGWADGHGGHRPVDLDQLAAEGIDLRPR